MVNDDRRIFVRVYRLPERLSHGFCFGPGVPIVFQNVDWFETLYSEGQIPLVEFIKRKQYYSPQHRFLVLGDDPLFVFVIEKE